MGEHTNKAAAQETTARRSKSPLLATERGFGAVERWLNYIGVTFTILLMLWTVTQVIARRLFMSPLVGYIDIMELLMVPLVFFCIAYCQREGGHIRMEIFLTRVLGKGRSYHAVESFILVLSLVTFGIICYYSVIGMVNAYVVGDSTVNIFFPTWPPRLAVSLGSFFLCVRFIIQLIHNIGSTMTGARPQP